MAKDVKTVEKETGTPEFQICVDRKNYRKHNDRNKSLIKRSLEENGAGRSIVVDNTGMSIGGSGVLEQAEALGIKKKIVETDGSELVVVVRKDISPDDPRRKELALADNATSDSSEWDIDNLTDDFDNSELKEWGIEIPEETLEPQTLDAESENIEECVIVKLTFQNLTDYERTAEILRKMSKDHAFTMSVSMGEK